MTCRERFTPEYQQYLYDNNLYYERGWYSWYSDFYTNKKGVLVVDSSYTKVNITYRATLEETIFGTVFHLKHNPFEVPALFFLGLLALISAVGCIGSTFTAVFGIEPGNSDYIAGFYFGFLLFSSACIVLEYFARKTLDKVLACFVDAKPVRLDSILPQSTTAPVGMPSSFSPPPTPSQQSYEQVLPPPPTTAPVIPARLTQQSVQTWPPPPTTAPVMLAKPTQVPPSSAQMPPSFQPAPVSLHPAQHTYQKHGGVLLAVVVILLIYTAVTLMAKCILLPDYLSLGEGYQTANQVAFKTLNAVSAIVSLMQTSLCAALLIMVYYRIRLILSANLSFFIASLVTLGCLCSSCLFIPIAALMEAGLTVWVSLASALFGIVLSAFLCVYFLKSVRVRTYMRNDDYITKTFWKFVKPPLPAVSDAPKQVL